MSKNILADIPTTAPEGLSKKEARAITKERIARIAELHRQLVAVKKHNLLVVLQGMDSSGKDGAMRNVFGPLAPYGLRVAAWKRPTEEEFAHDFLWRIHKAAPAKGEIVVFDRSHYEDILIQRVHGWISEERVRKRMDSINAFEQLLQYDNQTTILKFYLHLSHSQQELELRERMEDPTKYYKHNPNDWREREHWDRYMEAYEDVFSWSKIPWHIIPVDQRWYRDYLISEVLLNTLEGFQMTWPALQSE